MRNDYSKLKIRVTKSWDGIKGKKWEKYILHY
jgi:hypothetical protein